MSNRAIRNSQLKFDTLHKDKYAFIEILNANLNADHTVWTFLQDAQHYDVQVGGIPAHEYQRNVANLTQGHQYQNLTEILHHIFNFMLTETLEKEFASHRSTILDNMKVMRDELKNASNTRWGLDSSHPDYNAKFEKAYEDIFTTLNTIGENVSRKFNSAMWTNHSRNIVQSRWYANMFNGATADEHFENMVNHPTTYLFNINLAYLIPYVSYDSYYNQTQHIDLDATTTSFTDAEIKSIVSSMKSKNARLHLEIAALHEFALANPQVASMAQSWTSRHRSDWCFFKQPLDQVSKKNTLSCNLMSDLFGKHTPTFAGLKADWEAMMNQIVDDVKNAESALEKAQQKEAENEAKTATNIREALVGKINDMLTNGDADEEADALTLVSTLAGITSHSLNNRYGVEYYDYNYGQKHTTWIHWNTLVSFEIDMANITLTDAQQEIINTRYNQRRKELTESHAHRCAQLARQIANETTRHDEAMKSMQEAFTAYRASV